MKSRNRRSKPATAVSCVAIAVVMLAIAVRGIGAPPPNDNFENRTILTGSSNEFTGTLAEATLRNEVRGQLGFIGDRGSVWWSWTALESIPVTLQIIDLPFDSQDREGINVWAPTNLPVFPTNAEPPGPLAYILFDGVTPGMWVTFMAQAGQEYELQLVGFKRGTFRLRLVAGGAPFIFEQPRSQTVPVGGSALLGLMAAGPTPFYYRWFRDGTELEGETAPTVALNSLGPQHAGGYSVVVSNAYGATTSQVAFLEVRDLAVRPFISQSRVLSNNFEFVLNAESNRYYRIESSTNGTTWLRAEYFFRDASSRKTSVVGMTDSMASVSVPTDTLFKLFRASVYGPESEVCNNNLRRTRFAKRIWARQFHRERWHVSPMADLRPYMNIQVHPDRCPNGGTYAINQVQVFPTCTLTNHVLEEPW